MMSPVEVAPALFELLSAGLADLAVNAGTVAYGKYLTRSWCLKEKSGLKIFSAQERTEKAMHKTQLSKTVVLNLPDAGTL